MKTLAAFILLLIAAVGGAPALGPAAGTLPGEVYLPLVIKAQGTPTLASVATTTPTSTPTPTTQPATATPTATATTEMLYICTSDAYNCSDFDTQAEAQAAFDYCVDLGFGDIHRLDQDNNQVACESLP